MIRFRSFFFQNIAQSYAAKDANMLEVLLLACSQFFWNHFFVVFCLSRSSVSEIVGCFHDLSPESVE